DTAAPALAPPRLGPRQGLAVGRLGGRDRPRLRRRGRGLPLDPLLRLRRLSSDDTREPDRPDRAHAAAAQRGLTGLWPAETRTARTLSAVVVSRGRRRRWWCRR